MKQDIVSAYLDHRCNKRSEEICKNCKHLGIVEHLNAHTCSLSIKTFSTVEKTPGMAGYTTGETVPLNHTCDKFEPSNQ
jgi:hypothetical protein